MQVVDYKMSNNDIYKEADCGFSFDDPRVQKVLKISLQKGRYSTGLAQSCGLGQPVVVKLTKWLESNKIIGPSTGNRPRDLLIKTMAEAKTVLSEEKK